jgi:hypothetical protein
MVIQDGHAKRIFSAMEGNAMDTAEERQKSGKEEIVRRLERRPEVKARVLRLLDMVENTDGDLNRADEAEQWAIEELRALGRELLQSWAQGRVSDEVSALLAQDGVVQQVKKTPLAQHLR